MLNIYIDGGSNKTTIGEWIFIVYEENGDDSGIHRILKGKHTNNKMEYLALIKALEWIREQESSSPTTYRVLTDSLLVFNQVNGNWKIRDVKIKQYNKTIKRHLKIINKHYECLHIVWIPRNKNLAGKELEKIQKQRKRDKVKRLSSKRGWYVDNR